MTLVNLNVATSTLQQAILDALAELGFVTDTELRANPLPVSVSGVSTSALQTSVGVTAHADATAIISAINAPTGLPLPTGAATSANQVTEISSLASIEGHVDGLETLAGLTNTALTHITDGTQQTKITDGTNLGNILKSDGTAAGQNAVLKSGTFLSVPFTTTTVQALASTDVGNYRSVSVHIVAQGGSSLVNFQGSNNNIDWVSVALLTTNLVSANNNVNASGVAGVIYAGPLNYRYFRLNVTGIVSGTTSGTVTFFTDSYGNHANGMSIVSIVPGTTATTLGKAEDAAHASGDTGVMLLAVRNDANTALATTDLDYIPLGTDANGALRTIVSGGIIPGQGATNLGKAEDAAHASGDIGVMMLAVRRDGGGTTTDATGDYSPVTTDSQGNVRTVDRSSVAEDSVAADASFGVPSFAVRRDVAASSSGTDGDWSTINTNSIGDLRVFESSVEVASQFAAILNDVDISVKATAGYLRSLVVTNINAAVRYIQVHNKASAPAGADTPIWSIPIPAGTANAPAIVILGADIFGPGGLSCTTGVSIGVSTTAGTFTAATTTDHTVHGMYV